MVPATRRCSQAQAFVTIVGNNLNLVSFSFHHIFTFMSVMFLLLVSVILTLMANAKNVWGNLFYFS